MDNKENRYVKIPGQVQVGGVIYPVFHVDRVDGNAIGESFIARGDIRIAHKFDRNETQSESQKVNTFWHELVHTILGTMGKTKLNSDEEFVCTFSSFLCEATKQCFFKE